MDESTHQNRMPPLPWRWQARAIQWLDFPLGRFLDYGCGDGGLMVRIRDLCTECHGVDVRPDAFGPLHERHPKFTLKAIEIDGKTDYPNDFFDTIAIVEVIEHVGDERATLAEIARILKPEGKLLLTTPHRGLLTFLDVGNVKFAFPRLHWFAHWLQRDRQDYERRFGSAGSSRLIGDITVSPNRRPWHRHYTPQEIEAFCPPTLVLERHGVYFPGMRALMFLRVTFRVACVRRLRPFPPPLPWLERRLSRIESNRGDQLVMMLEKRAEHEPKTPRAT